MPRKLEIIGLSYEVPNQSTEGKETIRKQWEDLENWFEKLPTKLKGVRVYCEAFYVNQPKNNITENEPSQEEKSLERVVWNMLERGAEIEGTENRFLHQLVGRLTKLGEIADRLPKSDIKKEIMEILESEYNQAQKERERFIAEQIDSTLSKGEWGFLFIGAGHQIEELFPSDIEVRTWWIG